MTRSRQLLVLAATAAVSAALAILTLKILENEAPAAGALSVTLTSEVLGEDRGFLVHLPEGYEPNGSRRYPVLYVLDGASQSEHTADSAALLARIGLIPPVIVVGVPSLDGDTRNRDFTPPNMKLDTDDAASATGAADRFLRHLETELIPRIEADYPTSRPRLLAGWSRGGLFVVYSLLTAPGLFDARFAHSPALWRENDLIVTELERTLAASTVPDSFLYLSLGEQENEKMKAAFEHLRAVLESGAGANFRWRADLSQGGSHQSNPELATPMGLCTLFNPGRSCSPAQ